jgi:hypothetical protein
MPTATIGRARLAALGLYLAPVLLSGVAFRAITGVAFHDDDYLHLYDLVNLGPGQFLLTNFGGHLQLARNVVYVALYAGFGPHAPSSMVVVLLTHLLNVALLVWAIWRLTGNGPVASVAAAWWGTSAVNLDTLGWLSVYGQVLSVTATLWVVGRVAGLAAGGTFGRATPAACSLAAVVAATSFGSGLAAALCLPLVAWLLLAPSAGRRRLVRALALTAAGLGVLYLAADRLNVWLFGTPSAAYVVPFLGAHVATMLRFFVQLVVNGTAVASLGPFFPPLQALGSWTTPLAGALALLLLALSPAPRHRVFACLVLSLAPYAAIAQARFLLALNHPIESALVGRYHYAAPLGIVLALALAVAALLDRLPARWPRALYLAGGYGAAIAVYACCFPPVPQHEAAGREVERALAGIVAAVRASPPGADVYVRHQPFFWSDVTSITVGEHVIPVPPGHFPGVAGLFALFHPSHVVEGRRVFFVVGDPVKLASWRHGRHGSTLLVSEGEMRARGGSPIPPGTSALTYPAVAP